MASEDFTTYEETDPNSKITVTSSKVSWNDLSRNEEAYVYKNMGYNFFNKDFTHKFKVQFSDYQNGYTIRVTHWALSENLDDEKVWIDNSYNAVNLFIYDYTWNLYLRIYDEGWPTSDIWSGAQDLTTYYITITRNRDGGGSNSGRYTAYICTGGYYGEGGNLEDTLQVDSQAAVPVDWHFIFACNTYNDGGLPSCDGFTQDLDLGLFNPALALKANNLLGARDGI